MAFTFTNSYLQGVYEDVCKKNIREPEFFQTVGEVLESLQPVAEQNQRLVKSGVIDRVAGPERGLLFRISWVGDHGRVQVNRGYRVQFSTAIGPSKSGLRFHPSVNLPIIKFLGFEQVFKNSLTGLPMGGGGDGVDFDPKGKSDNEVMCFCQPSMTELQRHVGPDTDIPTGGISVEAHGIDCLFGQCKHIRDEFNGMLTGKDLSYGGSLTHTEATGYGLCYFADEMLGTADKSFQGRSVMVSGSGNMAIYANQKATKLGGKVIAMSDPNSYIVGENGIDYKVIQEIKKVKRARIKTYLDYVPTAKYFEDCQGIWTIPCGVALPCATQNELPLEGAKALVERGCFAVAEDANMPSTPETVAQFQERDVLFAPAKASSTGGVATSGLEVNQNPVRLSWTFEEVDRKLHTIIHNIYHSATSAAAEYGMEGNPVAGTGIAGFMRVADAIIWQGVSY